MPFIRSVECMSCGMCKEVCPHDAIKENSTHGYAQFTIDQTKCKQCGACLKVDCPADAITELKNDKDN